VVPLPISLGRSPHAVPMPAVGPLQHAQVAAAAEKRDQAAKTTVRDSQTNLPTGPQGDSVTVDERVTSSANSPQIGTDRPAQRQRSPSPGNRASLGPAAAWKKVSWTTVA